MFVAIHHNITDPRRGGDHEPDRPDGRTGEIAESLKAVFYLPGTDGRKADGVWETDSVDNLEAVP